MRVAVDLDGVCYEWERTARYMLREYRGRRVDESLEWDSIKDSCSKDDWQWLWSEGVRLGLFRYGHMTTGAMIGMRRLIKAGHKLEVVSHRPAHAHDDTMDWLHLYFRDIPLTEIILIADGSPKVKHSAADYLIDDKYHNLVEWQAEGRSGCIFNRPWNTGPRIEGITRTFGWKDTANVVILNGNVR